MALGFDFNQLMQDPAFQMGLGMLAQPRSWENRGFTGIAQGAMQGIGNLQRAQQLQQQQAESKQMQEMRAAAMLNDAAENERKKKVAEARMALVERIRGTAPQPRPLAFKPQPGDAEKLQDFNEVNIAADAIAAGGDPNTYLTRSMNLADKKEARAARAEESAAAREARKAANAAAIEARLEIAKMQGATATQIAQMRLDLQRESKAALAAQRVTQQENRDRDTELKLADDYERESKPYKTMLTVFAPIEEYVGGIEKGTAPATPAGDRSLVFAYARTLDPNDRVGVRDVQDIQKLGNIPEQWGAALRGLAAGRSLPPRVRADMYAEMKRRFEEANRTQLKIENEFSERTSRYNLNPKNVARPIGRRTTIKFSDLPK